MSNGTYGNFVALVNRSTQPLEGTFDGQVIKIPAGYVDDGTGNIVRALDGYGRPVVTLLPPNVAAIVKSQLPVMGTQDPLNPNPDEYLVGVEKWPTGRKDDISHREQSDAIEIIDRGALTDESRATDAETIPAKGRRKSRATVAVRTKTLVKTDIDD